jgi:hypothetical protein
MTSPTARSLAHCRKLGLTAQVVEHWNAFSRRRVDLFGVIDIVVLSPIGICGIQTTGAGASSRMAKIRDEPRAELWLRAGGELVVHSWRKVGPRGKRKLWSVRVVKAVLREGKIEFEETTDAR